VPIDEPSTPPAAHASEVSITCRIDRVMQQAGADGWRPDAEGDFSL
jgi:hypothetical protein